MTHEKTCFVIMPIGPEGSEIRKNSNEVYNYLIIPGVSRENQTDVQMYPC